MNKKQSLTPNVAKIVCDKATEHPFSGEYTDWDAAGTYLCRLCGLALFRSETKFHSACGWPSFDGDIKNAGIEQPDIDGRRTEILCSRCHAHLGHEFRGEGMTVNNTRHCVNSLSLDYVADMTVTDTEEAIFAAGCFWGVEHYFKKLPGVLKTEGYTGGHTLNPTYTQVCAGNTGHVEAIRVIYDPSKISYEEVTKYFFEIHNPIQYDGQGPDIGSQYLSVIFYYDETQEKIARALISTLTKNGLQIATRVLPVSPFWRAEDYHQLYYLKSGKEPYCHRYEKRFF